MTRRNNAHQKFLQEIRGEQSSPLEKNPSYDEDSLEQRESPFARENRTPTDTSSETENREQEDQNILAQKWSDLFGDINEDASPFNKQEVTESKLPPPWEEEQDDFFDSIEPVFGEDMEEEETVLREEDSLCLLKEIWEKPVRIRPIADLYPEKTVWDWVLLGMMEDFFRYDSETRNMKLWLGKDFQTFCQYITDMHRHFFRTRSAWVRTRLLCVPEGYVLYPGVGEVGLYEGYRILEQFSHGSKRAALVLWCDDGELSLAIGEDVPEETTGERGDLFGGICWIFPDDYVEESLEEDLPVEIPMEEYYEDFCLHVEQKLWRMYREEQEKFRNRLRG